MKSKEKLYLILMVASFSNSMDSNCKFNQRNQLDCYGLKNINELDALAANISKNIEQVSIRESDLDILETNSFFNFSNLEEIDVTDTGLTIIEPFAFRHLTNLKSVNIIRNNNETLNEFSWLSFATMLSSDDQVDFKQLYIADTGFKCSCNLEWLIKWKEYKTQKEKTIQMGNSTLSLTAWQLYRLPNEIVAPDSCLLPSKIVQIVTIAEYLNNSRCNKLRPKLRVTFHRQTPTSEPIDQFDEFDRGSAKFAKCTIANGRGRGRRSVCDDVAQFIGISFVGYFKQFDEHPIAESDGCSITVDLNETGIDRRSAMVVCHLTSAADISAPVIDAKPLLIIDKPRILYIYIDVALAHEKYCEFAFYSYPEATLSWRHQTRGKITYNQSMTMEMHRRDDLHYYRRSGYLRTEDWTNYMANYMLSACNRFGCDTAVCGLFWRSFRSPHPLPSAVDDDDGLWWLWPYALVTAIVVVICCATIGLVLIAIRYRSATNLNNNRFSIDPMEMAPLNGQMEETNILYQHIDSLPKGKIVDRKSIKMETEIGEGMSSKVYKGEITNRRRGPSMKVAIKILTFRCKDVKENAIKEASCLSLLTHPNIVQFIGISLQSDVWLIFEYMNEGDLRSFLQSKDPETNQKNDNFESLAEADLIHIASQIAHGLSYLNVQHIVHRDLAARNCLVAEKLRVKLSDFGMSRDIYYSEYYKVNGQCCMPVRWMAPEAITRGVFTHAGDVWSFGVVLWEIVTFGKLPWFGYSNSEVICKVQVGEVPTMPEGCAKELKQMMEMCWKKDPTERKRVQWMAYRLEQLKSNA